MLELQRSHRRAAVPPRRRAAVPPRRRAAVPLLLRQSASITFQLQFAKSTGVQRVQRESSTVIQRFSLPTRGVMGTVRHWILLRWVAGNIARIVRIELVTVVGIFSGYVRMWYFSLSSALGKCGSDIGSVSCSARRVY